MKKPSRNRSRSPVHAWDAYTAHKRDGRHHDYDEMPEDMDAFRNELARRINALVEAAWVRIGWPPILLHSRRRELKVGAITA